MSDGPTSPRTRRAIVVCDQWLGSNGYAGMKALRRAGWVASVVPEWEFVPVRWQRPVMHALGRIVRTRAVREFNDEVLRIADHHRPQIFLAFKGMFVLGSTLRALRERGVETYCFYPDNSFRTHGPYLPNALPHYDWIFIAKRFGARDLREQLGMERVTSVLHAFDPDLHRPVQLDEDDRVRYDCDVSFIGTWSPKKEALLAALIAARPSLRVRIWGKQWERARDPRALAGSVMGIEVVGEEYPRAIIASRINLGILSERRTGASDGDQVTSRTMHIPASGGFMLHERTAELLEIFDDGRDIATYDGPEELVRQVDRFLADDEARGTVAAAGRETVVAKHSWDHRIREILAHREQRAAR